MSADWASETEFRAAVQAVFDGIDRALRDVDPDVVECDSARGALTLAFADGTRCILSTQPSVRQIWLAMASRGMAHHFNYDFDRGAWMDDKGKGVELRACLRDFLRDQTRLEVKL